jgi:thiol-disulfide isomerase/thioredoxin
MDKTIKIVLAVLAIVVVAGIAVLAHGTSAAVPKASGPVPGVSANDTIYFFYGEECSHCHKIMPFIINMTKKYPDANIRILEVWHNQTNQQIFQQANAAAGITTSGVPEVIAGTVVLTGEVEIPEKFESLIQEYQKKI